MDEPKMGGEGRPFRDLSELILLLRQGGLEHRGKLHMYMLRGITM